MKLRILVFLWRAVSFFINYGLVLKQTICRFTISWVRSACVFHESLTYHCITVYSQVPLLILQFKNGQSIDIQFPDEQFQAIRNTNLIRHYVQVRAFYRKLLFVSQSFWNFSVIIDSLCFFFTFGCFLMHCISGIANMVFFPHIIFYC